MVCQSSEVQQGKRIKVADDEANHEAVCHDFWNKSPEDILLEIFIRLPDSRSAIRTDAVCHYWHSLITHNPRFIPRFKSHHRQYQHRYPLHSAIIFRKAEQTRFRGPEYFQPICKLLFSEYELKFCSRSNFLDFLPCSPMVIRATCNDLLLVSPDSCRIADLYVCNPITKQFVHLPGRRTYIRDFKTTGYALVSMPNSQFKVVEVLPPSHPAELDPDPDADSISLNEKPRQQCISIFCSESRKWEVGSFHYPTPKIRYQVYSLDVVRCNGVLYWLEFHLHVERIIYWDLSGWCGGVIDLPGGFPKRAVQIGTVRVQGGVEELRLLRYKRKESFVDLKVWRLDCGKDWVLVRRKKKLKMPKNINNEELFAGPFFIRPMGIWFFWYGVPRYSDTILMVLLENVKRSAILKSPW